jgi:hypothetical protein
LEKYVEAAKGKTCSYAKIFETLQAAGKKIWNFIEEMRKVREIRSAYKLLWAESLPSLF